MMHPNIKLLVEVVEKVEVEIENKHPTIS